MNLLGRIPITFLLLLPTALSARAVASPIIISGPILVANRSLPCTAPTGATCLVLSLTGSGLGAQVASSSLVVWNTSVFAPVAIPATDPNVLLWNDTRIVVLIPANLQHPTGLVSTSAGSSNRFLAERWSYDSFSTVAGGGPLPKPNFLTTDGFSVGWLVEEFGPDLKWWDLSSGIVSRIPIPTCGDECFRTSLSSATTRLSDTAEDVTLEPGGKVWFTQGGRWDLDPADAPIGNHSRILSYEPQPFFPSAGTFRIYNIPGDRNMVFPVAWDRVHGRVWFSERPRPGIRPNARIVTFDPEGVAGRSGQPANNFNFSAATRPCVQGVCSNAPSQACETAHDCVLADELCPGNATFLAGDSDCFHAYDIPDSAWVFGLLPAPSGDQVWFADWFPGQGPYLGRLDAISGAVTRYPLGRIEQVVDGAYRLSRAANGDILLVRLLVNSLARFDIARAGDPTCRTLTSPDPNVDCVAAPDDTCRNPCISEIARIPGFEGASSPLQVQVQELSEDPSGNVWFTQFSQNPPNLTLAATVGFWKADRSGIALFPPFALFPSPSVCGGIEGFQSVGVNAAENGDVWFADYCRNQLGRLRRL